ncbi:outer membrane protein assembly factor BamA [Undibacter mobilis]|uniref:Outer membrane protein assembly factor BamA n=1 Tax=Undibacter mobilis TaxID=2292256 RepID=A0A371B132_9BRAD|nr:outer membrane protein assembly factor BamA [Undibacter mobilis]RDV01237.1 outer membrane protein assembly factor BamA [Undibacter mobilis]
MGLSVRVIRGLTLSLVFLGGIVVGTAGVTISSSTPAMAQSANSIVVQGNRRVEAETIRSYFRSGSGRLGPVEIDEGLKALYATGLFEDVRTSNTGGRLVVTVVENPVINQVAFEGNKKAKDDQLKLEVQSKARGTLSKPTVQSDVQRIIEIYQRSGRFDVTVTPKIIELPNNRVNLVFEIKEGDKTGVKDIRFVGNKAFSRSRLKDVIKTAESNFLSFLQTTDIYDPDRVEADRDLLRRFYLKYGYADVRIISAVGEYDPSKKGFIITFTIDEGPQYRVGTVDVISNVRAIDTGDLRGKVKLSPGSVYNADLVEKSVEAMAIEAAKRGYAFANVRPRGERKVDTRTINLAFVVEEGTRAYIERINIRGNNRTRDYVIRREFDISEGDAYNRALIDRAERRLKNLNYFKTVKITNEPGSAPDRVVVNVNVEEQSTGEFSIAGGYSTADGFIAEASVADRNLMGRGQYAKAAVTYGQRTRGVDLNFVEPYLLGYRMAGGVDLFWRKNTASNSVSYSMETYGTNLRLGFALTEELSFSPRYSIYRQKITLPDQYNNCISTASPMFTPTPSGYNAHQPGAVKPLDECYADGEASLAVRKELANGPVTVSMLGYTTAYNTLDNNKNPTSGLYAELKQDLAGVGGDVNFIRTTAEARTYYEVVPDVVGVLKLQGGNIAGWGSKDLRMLDHFQMGPNIVRGFASNGIGPRDITPGSNNDSLGGTKFWGASLEVQTPLYFLPKEIGIKLAAFADAGNVWGYEGPTSWSVTGETLQVGLDSATNIRSSVGVGLIWDSPLGPLRFDFAYPLKKYCSISTGVGATEVCDRTQMFRFGGGTKF